MSGAWQPYVGPLSVATDNLQDDSVIETFTLFDSVGIGYSNIA